MPTKRYDNQHLFAPASSDNGPSIIAPQPGPQTDFLSTSADIAIYGGSAGGGKMLPLVTRIPTPTGWATIGDLVPGDQVFTEYGLICNVTDVHPVAVPDTSYIIEFDDGSIVHSCGEHLWYTYDAVELGRLTAFEHKSADRRRTRNQQSGNSRATGKRSEAFIASITKRNKERAEYNRQFRVTPTGNVRTTQEIFDTQRIGKSDRVNHAIQVSAPLQLPEQELPLDPYLLGVWLGDGTATEGAVTTADAEIIQSFENAGHKCTQWKDETRFPGASGGYTWGVSGLVGKLRALGVLGNKHIPAQYLRASYTQRLALLQGLCDTDGTCNTSGQIGFDNTNWDIITGAAELIRSLGSKAHICGGKDAYCHSIKWTATYTAFRLQRKRDRQKTENLRRTSVFRYIVDVREDTIVEPMRCITVDNPTGLYLCTDAMIPTHNTWSLLLDPLRYMQNVAGFGGVIVRRSFPQIMNEGGLWDASKKVYLAAGADPTESAVLWKFPPYGNKLAFRHMQHEADLETDWQGSEIPFVGFDELTHFTRKQFFYLLSRNRSTCGVQPYMRATCNPDANSWVKAFLAPWLDRRYTGPLRTDDPNGPRVGRARSGEIRYFTGEDGIIRWCSKHEYQFERATKHPTEWIIKSVTFIRASVFDNKELLRVNPGYIASLKALPLVEQQRLLWGNWDINETGNMFRAEWLPIHFEHELPDKFKRIVAFFDLAGTKPSQIIKKKDDPDYSACALLGLDHHDQYYLIDVSTIRDTPEAVEAWMVKRAKKYTGRFGGKVEFVYEEEPGSSGKFVTHHLKILMRGYSFRELKSTGSKIARAKPISAQCQRAPIGSVWMMYGEWNEDFMAMASAFPSEDVHDDVVDALSGAYAIITGPLDMDIYRPAMSGVSTNTYVPQAYSAGTMQGELSKFHREREAILRGSKFEAVELRD